MKLRVGSTSSETRSTLGHYSPVLLFSAFIFLRYIMLRRFFSFLESFLVTPCLFRVIHDMANQISYSRENAAHHFREPHTVDGNAQDKKQKVDQSDDQLTQT